MDGEVEARVNGDAWALGAVGLRQAYVRRDVSPVEMVEMVARRLEAIDPVLCTFTTHTLDRAMEDARIQTERLARGDAPGSLHGVPVGIKELFDVDGARTTYGSTIFADRVAPADAEAVLRLRRAGAIVVGITRSHEFGWGITTQHATLGGT